MVDESTEGGAPPNGGQGTRDTEVSIPPIAKTRLLRSRRQIVMQIVAAMVILACGIVIGAGGVLLGLKENIAPGPMPPPDKVAHDMQERYGLTEEQTGKVKTAVRESSERMRELFQDFKPKMEAAFKQFSADIEEILTAEQFKQWENDFRSRRHRRPGRFGPRREGPDGRPGPGRPPRWDGRRGRRPGPEGESKRDWREYERNDQELQESTEPNAAEE